MKEFSDTAFAYLECFYEILDQMIQEMTAAELSCSISHNFIVQMIPHHMAAIEMSHNLLQYDPCPPLKKIALDIIAEQTKSIENMQSILPLCSRKKNCPEKLCSYQNCFNQIAETMFSEMQSACSDNNINGNFMREMIPHHRGAIRMSQNAFRFPICPSLCPILRAIITSQTAGIHKMEYLLCMSEK